MKKLTDAIALKKTPIVVGLDPTLAMIPKRVTAEAQKQTDLFESYAVNDIENSCAIGSFLNSSLSGKALLCAAYAVFLFNKEIIDAVCDLVPAVKLQSAMYEMLGIPGIIAYKRTVDYAKQAGLFVIGDIKRGDIGSTSKAYATGHLGSISLSGEEIFPFDEDACTVNPYLGSDGVLPFAEVCKEHGKGIFVLVKTSNPSSAEFQDLKAGEKELYIHVAEKVNEWGASLKDGAYSLIGAVTGATYPEEGKILRDIMPDALLLVPGYGAQGAKGSDLKPFFKPDGSGAIINSSRGIIAAWQQERYSHLGTEAAGDAARAAVLDMKEDISGALG